MGLTRGFQAVSVEEYEEIVATGEFKVGPNSMEGKWFADTLDGAIAHGNALYPDRNFKLVRAELPDGAPSLFKEANIDGKGLGRYLAIEDLGRVRPFPMEEKP